MKKVRIFLSILFMIFTFSVVCLKAKVDVSAASYITVTTDDEKVKFDLGRINIPTEVISSFPVTTSSMFGSEIKYESSNNAALDVSYVESTGWILVNRSAETEQIATITVTVTNGDKSDSKDVQVKVPAGVTNTNEITISYNEISDKTTVTKVGLATSLEAGPYKEGFEFKGWYEKADNEFVGNPHQTSLGFISDVTLYAKYEVITIESITVKTNPNKLVYTALETPDLTGLVLEAKYSNGETKEITEGYSTEVTTLHGDDTKVSVSYDGKTTEIEVIVNKITMSGVALSDSKVTYDGDEHSILLSGELPEWLDVVYDGNNQVDANETGYTVTAIFSLKDDNKYEARDYNVPDALTATLIINKADPIVNIVEFGGTYYTGHGLPTISLKEGSTDGTISWNYSDIDSVKLLENENEYNWKFVPSDATNYKEATGTVTIKASNATINGIEVSGPTKKNYKAFETLDTTGLIVNYVLDSGDKSVVSDYVVVYENNTDSFRAGDTTVTIKVGDYSQEITGFTVDKADIDTSSLVFTNTIHTYDGTAKEISAPNSLPDGLVIIGYTYSEKVNCGTHSVKVTFKVTDETNYNVPDTMTVTMIINPKSIENVTIVVDDVVVDGRNFEKQTPSIIVKDGETTLTIDTDYIIESYSDITEISSGTSVTAKVTIKGKGNYDSETTATKEFTIKLSDEVKIEEDAEEFSKMVINFDEVDELPTTLSNGSTIEFTKYPTFASMVDGQLVVISTNSDQSEVVEVTIKNGNESRVVSVTCTLSALSYTVTFDCNGGKLDGYASLEEIAADFLNDYNTYAGTSLTHVSEYWSANQKSSFWKDATLNAKWKWMIEILIPYAKAQGQVTENLTALIQETPTVNGYALQNVMMYLLGINYSIWNETYKDTCGGLASKWTTVDCTSEEIQNSWKSVCNVINNKFTPETELELPTPTREGYTFLGWYLGETLVTKIEKGTTNDVTLVAKWKVNSVEHEISYDVNEGVLPEGAVTRFVEGTGLETLPTPTRDGYTFLGWYEGDTLVESIPADRTSDIALKAKWEEVVSYKYSIDDFTTEFLADWNNYAVTQQATADNFQNSTANGIKEAFANAEMVTKYKWLFEYALVSLTEANQAHLTELRYTNTKEVLEGLIAGDTEIITGSGNAEGRTLIRHWLHGLMNKELPTENPAYTAYSVDFSKEENQASFLAAYNAYKDAQSTTVE